MASSSRGSSRARLALPGPRGRLRSTQIGCGQTRWCGPAVVALATGLSYAGACALLRTLAPERYPAGQEIVTTYWRDLLAGLERAGIAHAAVPLPEAAPSLLRMVRWHGLAPAATSCASQTISCCCGAAASASPGCTTTIMRVPCSPAGCTAGGG